MKIQLDVARDREEFELKKDLEERRMAHEVELKKYDLEISQNVSHSGSNNLPLRKGPKLPCFDESKDDMDSYLLRFERYANIHKIEECEFAVYLSAVLQGKALQVYTRLSPPMLAII